MSYMKINNLYKDRTILNFKRCYVLEKVHGTSAHVKFKMEAEGPKLIFYSGGAKHSSFEALFNKEKLIDGFMRLGHSEITVYGEAYGGNTQGNAKHIYGPDLRFICFDVEIGDIWLAVPKMDKVCTDLGLEVVPWEESSTDIEVLNALRDRPSIVAQRRGCGNDKIGEGIVIRPLEEFSVNNDHRVIVKHKTAAFQERATNQDSLNPEKLKVLSEAKEIAFEWVNDVRLQHVLDKLNPPATNMSDVPRVIKAMVEDIFREAEGEIVESREAGAAIGRRTVELFKKRIAESLK
jgi:hypothetical protein